MTAFTFTARTSLGKTIQGQRLVDSEASLALDLASEGLFLIRARPVALAHPASSRVKLTPKDLSVFLLHLAAYLEVGLTLADALRDYRNPDRPGLETAVQDMANRLTGGACLSEIMTAYPSLFLPIHVAMVRAGEATGRMDEAIRAVIKLVEWEAAFRAQVREAATYPLILLAIIGLIVLLVSHVSMPPILALLEGLQVPLPLVTRVFLACGHGLTRYGWLAAALSAGLWLGLRLALKRPAFRLSWDTALLTLPGLGPLATRMALSRFVTFFGAQYRAGIPMVQALRTCEEVAGNTRIALCIRTLRDGVEGGEKLAVMAARVGYFPQMVIRMLAIGEETGLMEETLAKTARTFDAEVATGVRSFFQLVDPVLKVGMACLLVFVASAVLLPLYQLIGAING